MPTPTLRPFPAAAAALAALLACAPPLVAQASCPDLAVPWTLEGPRLAAGAPDTGFLRTGSRTLGSSCPAPDSAALRGPLVPASLRAAYRSAYPFDRNDGAVWTGTGLSTSWGFGARFERGPLRVVVRPTVAFQENRAFDLATSTRQPNPVAHPYQRLDWPQRFGEAAFWTVDPGQSVIALTAGPAELALATENLWWGPARVYPLLLGNSAAGFPHVRVGLPDEVGIGIGTVRAHLLWGRLDESDHFDALDNDARLFTGVFAELRPAFLPGLTLGLSGVQHNAWEGGADLFLNLFRFASGGEEGTQANGLLSLTASWHLPESGLELWAEWAREDYWVDVEDFLTEADHSQAYLLGFEKLVGGERPSLRLWGELVQLDGTPRGVGRNPTNWYAHGRLPHGHTHRGQLLGAAIGPASNAQKLALDWLRPERTVGVYAERIRRDDITYVRVFAPDYGFRGRDLEWTLGLQGLEGVGPLTVRWDGAVSRRKNRSFIGLDGVSWDFLRETNLALTVTAWWFPGG